MEVRTLNDLNNYMALRGHKELGEFNFDDSFIEGIKAINKAIDTINEHKASIAVAPEGTRSKNLELLPFHAGTFNIAKRSGVPIVCVGIKNTNMIHKNFPKKFTKVNCDVIYIMEPEEYMDLSTVEIANKLHSIYEDYLQA